MTELPCVWSRDQNMGELRCRVMPPSCRFCLASQQDRLLLWEVIHLGLIPTPVVWGEPHLRLQVPLALRFKVFLPAQVALQSLSRRKRYCYWRNTWSMDRSCSTSSKYNPASWLVKGQKGLCFSFLLQEHEFSPLAPPFPHQSLLSGCLQPLLHRVVVTCPFPHTWVT